MILKKKYLSIFIRLYLSLIGSYGILRMCTSSVLTSIPDAYNLICALIFSLMFTFFFTNVKKWAKVGAVYLTAYTIAGIIFYKSIIAGLFLIADDWITALERSNGVELNHFLNGSVENELKCRIIAFIFFACLTAFCVNAAVSFFKGIVSPLLTVIPVMLVLISVNIIPDTISIVMCAAYIMSTNALHARKNGELQAISVFIVTCVIAFVACLFIPQKTYTRPDVFNDLNSSLVEGLKKANINLNNNNVQNMASAGIQGGSVGNVNGVKYTNQTILKLTTYRTGTTQYFPIFTGANFDKNSWSSTATSDTELNGYKLMLINMADSNDKMQKYITEEKVSYYDTLKAFPYRIDYVSEKKKDGGGTYINFNMDFSYYEKFAKLSSKEANLSFEKNYNERNPINYSNYIDLENNYRNGVYDRYLKVSDSDRKTIESVMGAYQIKDFNDEAYYIKRVKEFFNENFEYNMIPGKVPYGKSLVDYFLNDKREGYCTYFATCATLMFRCAGIPARYVEGYAVSDSRILASDKSNSTYERYNIDGSTKRYIESSYEVDVTDRCAHAWVEVYANGYGWIPIDVTPSAPIDGLVSDAIDNGAAYKDLTSSFNGPVSETTASPIKQDVTNAADNHTSSDSSIVNNNNNDNDNNNYNNPDNEAYKKDAANDKEDNGLISFIKKQPILAFFILLIAIIILCILFIILRYLVYLLRLKNREEMIRRRNKDKGYMKEVIVTEYERLLKSLDFAGLWKKPGESYDEYASYLCKTYPMCKAAHFDAITQIVLYSRYSPDATSLADYSNFHRHSQYLKENIYNNQSFINKLIYKYILCLLE